MAAFGKKPNKSLFGQSDALNQKYGLGKYAATGTQPGTLNLLGSPQAQTPGPAPIDYNALIQGDPIFGQEQSDIGAAGVSDAAQRAAAFRRALIEFGEVPDFGSLQLDSDAKAWLGTDIDDATRNLAGKNTSEGLSLMARLGKAHKDSLRRMKNQLAARGMLESGELGHGLSEEALRYKQGTFDARQALLDRIAGVAGSFAQSEAARKRQIAEAMARAGQRQLELLGSSPQGGAAAPAPSQAPGFFDFDPEALRRALEEQQRNRRKSVAI